MSWTRLALSNPTATLVGVLLVVLFGGLSLSRLPVQLTPEVERPEITIRTGWRAAAPEEVEAEIIEPQEKVLRGLSGVSRIVSKAQRGQGEVSIEFVVGHDLRRGLIEVLNRLNRVPRYPEDANEPVIDTVGGNSRAIAWFIARTGEGNPRDVQGYKDYAEEVVQTRFERVPGVARSEVYGGREREVRITFDPYKAAGLGVELPAAARLTGANQDVSGGDVSVGKRRYTLRFTGAFDAGELGELVLEWRDGLPVRLRDVADVEVALVDRKSFVLSNGVRSIAVNAHREIGVNVLEVMAGLKQAAAELIEGPLARAKLDFRQVYDETTYIHRSIEMVRNNLGLGVMLAIVVLWVFLRRFRATLLVAVAIPVSLFAAFLCLDFAGRTVNIISLAGLAFAVGMTLDAAIVVLENIVRLRERGMEAEKAAVMGPEQVWGALLASTATTVAIFLPIVFLEDEAGQLFADLALTIAMAVIASMVVALTVIPAAASKWLARVRPADRHARWRGAATSAIVRLTDGPARRTFWIVTLITIPLGATLALAPKSILGLVPAPERLAALAPESPWALRASYLPQGNRNLVFAFIIPPPGVNIDHLENEMGRVVAERIRPYLDGGKEPAVESYFFVAFSRGVFMGARTLDEARTDELIPIVNRTIRGFPDTIAFARRASLFGGFGSGNTIDVDVRTRNIEALMEAALGGFIGINQALPGARVRPFPGLELADPELRLVPDARRLAEAGWSREVMASVTRALGEGLYVGDYFDGEQRLDVVVRVQLWETPEELASIPLATPGGVLPVSELAGIVRTAGPQRDPPHRPSPHRHLAGHAAGRDVAGGGDRHHQDPGGAGCGGPAPRRRRGPFLRDRRQASDRAAEHGRQLPARDHHPLPAHGGAVPILQGQPAGAARAAARHRGQPGGAAVDERRVRRAPVPGSAHHDRIHHPARAGGEQRDPAGAPDPGDGAARPRAAHGGGGGGGDAAAADPDEHPDEHLRDAAAAAGAGGRKRALPRPRRGHHRRHVRERGLHPAAAPEPAAHRGGREAAGGGAGSCGGAGGGLKREPR